MMHNWFECSIRYEKVAENGMNRKVTEAYLVDALSFTEAEARIIEVMNQERTLTFGKYKGTHRSNITGGFSAGDFGGLIYSIENFDESEHEF